MIYVFCEWYCNVALFVLRGLISYFDRGVGVEVVVAYY